MHALTLIADRDRFVLPAGLISTVRDAVAGGMPETLSSGEAVDIPCPSPPDLALVAAALGKAPVDVIVTPSEGRRKRLLVADMDSTIVIGETLDQLAGFAGIKEQVAAITARSLNDEVDFRESLRERVALLRGLALEALEACWRQTRFTPGAAALVATMRAHGALTALVSGGFTFFTGRVAAALGFHQHHANRLLDDGSALTGEVTEPILDRNAKLATLIALAAAQALPLTATMAIGDGANDLPMLRAAGLGIAFRPSQVVAAEARHRLQHTGLRGALFAQGYHAAEIVEA